MIGKPFLLLIAFLYVCILFTVAWRADQQKGWLQRYRSIIYSLALAVYCSSWTFFGAVGQSISSLWSFLPIYMGPVLLFVFGGRFLRKLLLVGERQKVTSIADFLGSRYGKNQGLSALVTLLAIAGSLPYIALQLRAVTMAWETLGSRSNEGTLFNLDTALVTALIMGLFAILFGTRQLEGRERNRGMVTAIALESVIKLLAFASVAMFAVWILVTTDRELLKGIDLSWQNFSLDASFFTQTLLATTAIICLPRQFHMAVVEYHDDRDLRAARWLLPLYLLAFSVLILPLSFAGHLLFEQGEITPDSLVLTFPMLEGFSSLSILAFIGGFSAATGMVIVAAVTLSVMISNELVAPLWLRFNRSTTVSAASLGTHLQLIRRISILALLLLGWGVNESISGMEGLAAIGLIAFAASAQLAPALVVGLYWKRAHRSGVLAGLVAGYGLWFYCLLLPAMFPNLSLVEQGFAGVEWLRPHAMFGLDGLDSLSHGVFWSLLFNIILFFGVSIFSRIEANDQRQADAYVDIKSDLKRGFDQQLTSIQMGQLRSLLEPFVGRGRIEEIWSSFERRSKQRFFANDSAPRFIVQDCERTLAGIVGSATAHQVIDLLRSNRPLQLEDIARLVDGTSQKLRFNERLLQTTVETVSQGISVVDAELRLVAWNTTYRKLFEYPERLLYIGCPVANLYYFNAKRGLYGEDLENVDEEVSRRLDLLRHGGAHRFERQLPNGIIIEVRGNPMPNGGFVTTYTDISDYRAVVDALEDAKLTLEERVKLRTEALSTANEALKAENRRRAEAEEQLRGLDSAKTRFLAHTSHDLLQPINAARLFVSAVQQKVTSGSFSVDALRDDVTNIDSALNSAEELIGALREMSRLDSGNLTPKREHFNINDLLSSLAVECQAVAADRNVQFHYIVSNALVISDRHLLRRILQNFLSNALRYTQRGRIVLGCRHRGQQLEIQVWDTGPGIAESEQRRIFEEFVRLASAEKGADKGLGLGLAIAKRSAALLRHPVGLYSKEGAGAMFSVTVPRSDADQAAVQGLKPMAPVADLAGVRILCIDNDPMILQGMKSLLQGWGSQVTGVSSMDEALEQCDPDQLPDIILVDYHLDEGKTGIEAMDGLAERWNDIPPAILVSADISESVRDSALERGFYYLAKPVKPAALRSLVRRLIRHRENSAQVQGR